MESLPIPDFDGTVPGTGTISLEPSVVAELSDYVGAIAENYRANVRSSMHGASFVNSLILKRPNPNSLRAAISQFRSCMPCHHVRAQTSQSGCNT